MTPEDTGIGEGVPAVEEIIKAVSEAMREAKRRHKLLGNPIVVWKDGKVVWVPPEEIQLEEEVSV